MKIYASVFVTDVGNPIANAEKMIQIMKENEADIYLFPAYCLTGISCSDLTGFQCFADAINEALDKLCEYSENAHTCIATAIAGYENIIIRDGELIQKGSATVAGMKVVVAETGDDRGGDILLLPTAMAGYPCIQNDIIEFCADASKSRKCVIAVANQGFGESSADNVYKGFAGIFNKGVIVDFKGQETAEAVAAKADAEQQTGLIYTRPNRGVDEIPYYGKNEPSRYLNELFILQVQALYTRLTGRQKEHIVIGTDDSAAAAAALLVAQKVMQTLSLPASNIIAVTKTEADTELAQIIGATIVKADADARAVTKQILDITDTYDAVSVGTVDLTDIALGRRLFGGETVREYNVNASIPKTLLKELIKNPQQQTSDTAQLLNKIADNTKDSVLEDFILFFFAKRNNAYSDIKNLCLAVFEDLDECEIVDRLDNFYKDFKNSQAKRSTVFEGANLIGFKLPYFPADIDYQLI